MYDLKFANQKLWKKETNRYHQFTSKIHKKILKSVSLMFWSEHCIECAIPDCYKSCSLYEKRKDGHCSRFVYGIYPNPRFKGRYNFGADIKFKRWSKLETLFLPVELPIWLSNHVLSRFILNLLTRFISIQNKLKNNPFSTPFFKIIKNLKFDEFLIECFSSEDGIFTLFIEQRVFTTKGLTTIFRTSFNVRPGHNLFRVPYEFFKLKSYNLISVYPDHTRLKRRRLIFTWLDFVRYNTFSQKKKEAPSTKVKCVAWDLDNTLWNGTLVNSIPNQLSLKDEVRYLIEHFDERGIIQTIVSKNTFEDAWLVIEKMNISNYFIYPQINWGQKSENLKRIAKKLNINLDTFAVIDDSPFERNEIKNSLHQVRVYSEKDLLKLLEFDEFDVPITDASRKRRLSYLAKIKRDDAQVVFSGDYEAFLKSCEIEMSVFVPKQENHILRCWELIQRSNQLNLSTNRYSIDEFRQLLNNSNYFNIAFSCRDKYGDYGIIGFSSIKQGNGEPVVQDFVLSCRVAQKKVEHTFFNWLALKEKEKENSHLFAKLIKTERNSPLFQVFSELPFTIKKQKDNLILMKLDLNEKIYDRDIIKVIDMT